MEIRNSLYPIFLKLEELDVLIIGGGNIALEKLGSILKSSPKTKVTIIAEQINNKVKELSAFYNITLIQKSYDKEDIKPFDLLIAATNNRILNEQIKLDAKEQRILTNVVDDPELCDFYLGSVVTKGNLKLGISTNGQSPTMAKKLRLFFEDVIPDEVEYSLESLHNVRSKLKKDLHHRIATLNSVTSVLDTDKDHKKEYKLGNVNPTDFKIYLN
ncbi:MAG: bifunctional precorrin-2 dehydrogenase/sirohydrochlorin ferrochelatase [Vicingus serpentipes]|nr:bifunctional precorrin-2 dehydrogenase/sirohydrochlorin ferrochelatase [Vicingus serpentipes]